METESTVKVIRNREEETPTEQVLPQQKPLVFLPITSAPLTSQRHVCRLHIHICRRQTLISYNNEDAGGKGDLEEGGGREGKLLFYG